MTLEQIILLKQTLEYFLNAQKFKDAETEIWLEGGIKILDDMIDRGITDDSRN